MLNKKKIIINIFIINNNLYIKNNILFIKTIDSFFKINYLFKKKCYFFYLYFIFNIRFVNGNNLMTYILYLL